MRSVGVVLPASMWPMLPMLRYCAMGVVGAMLGLSGGRGSARLPAVMGERLVGVGPLVGVFALLHGIAAAVGGIHQLCRELLGHAGPRAVWPGLEHRARRGRLPTLAPDIHPPQAGGGANPARARRQ